MLALKSVLIEETPTDSPEVEAVDCELLRGLRGGDEHAARQLYQRYARRLLSVAQARCTGAALRHLDANPHTHDGQVELFNRH